MADPGAVEIADPSWPDAKIEMTAEEYHSVIEAAFERGMPDRESMRRQIVTRAELDRLKACEERAFRLSPLNVKRAP